MTEYQQMEFPAFTEITRERIEQVVEKGYTVDHDREHGDTLLRAAACYVDWAASKEEGTDDPNDKGPHPFWPWGESDWNPGTPESAMLKGAAMVAAYWDANYAVGPV